MVDRRWMVAVALTCAVACGKSRQAEDDQDSGGSGGDEQGGSGGASGGRAGAGGVGGAAGRSGSGGNAGSSAGSGGSSGKSGSGGGGSGGGGAGNAGSAGKGGSGGTSGASGAGGSSAGSGGLTPVVDPIPAPGSSFSLPTGDPLNSTPPVLAPLGDAVVIAGSTEDPALAGVEAFEAGVQSEAFVAALDQAGMPLWSTPLLDAGMPQAIAIDANGDIVVVAAYLPDAPYVSVGFYDEETLIAKLSPTGTLLYARHVPFQSGSLSLALDADANIYVAGGEIGPNDDFDTATVLLGKYDAEATELWLDKYPHVGSTAYADSVAVTTSGEVVITGTFNGSMSLGGAQLDTAAVLGDYGMPNGFIARYTPDGEHVASERFGGTIFDGGNVVVALASGDVLLAGFLSGSATVGGKSVEADADGSAFLARLGDDDQAAWVELAGPGYAWAVAVDPAEDLFHVAGDLGPERWLAEFRGDGASALFATRPANDLFFTTSLAVDRDLGLWLAGGFMGSADFGGGNLLSSNEAGVFLVRLGRQAQD